MQALAIKTTLAILLSSTPGTKVAAQPLLNSTSALPTEQMQHLVEEA